MKPEQPSECSSCGCEERWLLHNFRLRGIFHRACTSCVLKMHPGSFCPICFQVYEGSLLPADRVICLRCPSTPHLACVTKDVVSCYICPPCLNPNFVFFDSKALTMSRSVNNGESAMVGDRGAIDVKSAKVLVAAAEIASISMNKAAASVRGDAEKRVKEAALARKRAREALQRVSNIGLKEKSEGKDFVVDKAPNHSLLVADQLKKFKGTDACAGNTRFENHQRLMDTNVVSASVVVPSDNVQSEDKERFVAFGRSNVVQRAPNNGVFADSKNVLKLERQQQLHKTGTATQLSDQKSNLVQGEKEKNGLFSGPHVSGPPQHVQNSNGIQEKRKSVGNQVAADILPVKSNK